MANPTVNTTSKRAAYMNTKIVMDKTYPGRAREIVAREECDYISSRISEESKHLDPRTLINLVDSIPHTDPKKQEKEKIEKEVVRY